jgi:hypothetical protein
MSEDAEIVLAGFAKLSEEDQREVADAINRYQRSDRIARKSTGDLWEKRGQQRILMGPVSGAVLAAGDDADHLLRRWEYRRQTAFRGLSYLAREYAFSSINYRNTDMSEPKGEQGGRDRSSDLLGVKGVADSVKILTEGMVKGAGAFLSRICLPAAKEYGLLLQDHVKEMRRQNAVRILNRAEEKLKLEQGEKEVAAQPRIVAEIIEKGTWIEDSEVQDLWAGLLSSSCSEDGDDDSNLIFLNILGQLTKSEAKILKYLCGHSDVQWYAPMAFLILDSACDPEAYLRVAEYGPIGEVEAFHRLEFEFHHLNSLDLVVGGPNQSVYLKVTSLALSLYVRCMGSRQLPYEYFKRRKAEPPQP